MTLFLNPESWAERLANPHGQSSILLVVFRLGQVVLLEPLWYTYISPFITLLTTVITFVII